MTARREALDAERAKGTAAEEEIREVSFQVAVGKTKSEVEELNSLVAGERHDDRRGDHVRVHAALEPVRHGGEGPVRHDAGDADFALFVGEDVGAGDQVLNGSGVEKLDVGKLYRVGRRPDPKM